MKRPAKAPSLLDAGEMSPSETSPNPAAELRRERQMGPARSRTAYEIGQGRSVT